MSKSHRLKTRKPGAATKALPLNFMLGCSERALDEFELTRLAEVADLRKELHDILDRTIDAMTQAAMASWFKSQDRNSLKHAIENEETPEEWAHRMIRDGQRSKEELSANSFLPSLAPGAAHRAASLKYQNRNLAEGKCRYCPKPQDPNSVELCTEHLAKARAREQQKKGLSQPGSVNYLYAGEIPSTHGRTLGTLTSLAKNREKKTREVLAELGLPLSSAVSLPAVKEALLRIMPTSKAKALPAYDLFEAAQIPTGAGRRSSTGYKALRELLKAGSIQSIGEPSKGHSYRYFK